MDASNDDQDIVLQRSSPELLADLLGSLDHFLWRITKNEKRQIRRRVRVRETDRLISLLEPFQELPQLLDPYLDKLIPVLADAFLAFLQCAPPKHNEPPTQLLIPLSRAICRLLYTFCKIRGEKVIVRFFSTEIRHLELLLSAIENGQESHDIAKVQVVWDWEERYIILLWLSQLLLAPFDLATISSADTHDVFSRDIPALKWPPNTPEIALRVIPLAIRFLRASGKERDAAKVLLVRVSMRRDMQDLGILQALTNWALTSLKPSSGQDQSAYFHIGVLSYLAGLLSSATGTKYMQPFLSSISDRVQQITADDASFQALQSLAIARKTIIKVLRTLSILALQDGTTAESSDIVEATISALLESLADPATPVRLAASKALSMVTLKLDNDLAAQVIEAVLESLKVNVPRSTHSSTLRKSRDLSRVNPYEWHGLILTLSHLLYRRSPPLESLPDILSALCLGLSFEQKSTTGASIGTNVRDAACFGIWALARRYSTAELQNIRLPVEEIGSSKASVLQHLATLLVVAGCLDPAGNIRRGSSAALQELIGRHPDTIDEGISVVQVVDYHAVALRSRAIKDVAVRVASLSTHYHHGLLDNLVGWRGIQDSNPAVRQDAASSFGLLTWAHASILDPKSTSNETYLYTTIISLAQRLKALVPRDADLRHGLLLSFTAVFKCMKPDMIIQIDTNAADSQLRDLGPVVAMAITEVTEVVKQVIENFGQYRNPELTAAAIAQLLSACYLLVRKDCELILKAQARTLNSIERNNYLHSLVDPIVAIERLLVSPSLAAQSPNFDALQVSSDVELTYKTFNHNFVATCQQALNLMMPLDNPESMGLLSGAAADMLLLLPGDNSRQQMANWILEADRRSQSSNNLGKTYLAALFRALPVLSISPNIVSSFIKMIKKRWTAGNIIETRVTILSCLSKSEQLHTYLKDFLELIIQGLDDYTTDARGDVGSFVRIEALRVVGAVWRNNNENALKSDVMSRLFGRVMRLCAEKLDKVRLEAHLALNNLLSESGDIGASFATLSNSSTNYFYTLLTLSQPSLSNIIQSFANPAETSEAFSALSSLLMGYVTSADTGSEDLVLASRSALATYCLSDADGKNSEVVFTALSGIIKGNEGEDRIVVPAMDVLVFLGDVGAWDGIELKELKLLFLRTQKAHFKTPNVKKLDVAIAIYGCILDSVSGASGSTSSAARQDHDELRIKVVEKLTSMLSHPFPHVREKVIEELWARYEIGKSMDVSMKSVAKDEVGRIRSMVLAASG